MRAASTLLAAVKPGRYLEPGNPTGLTGLFNHPAPRSTLLYIYGSTLDKLKALPEHSVYRQSVEALTKHRKAIIESIKPEGYEEWVKRSAEKVEQHPDIFQPGGSRFMAAGGQAFVNTKENEEEDPEFSLAVGPRTQQEEEAENRMIKRGRRKESSDEVKWEPEPALEASQIREAEEKIGGGLIEEVIQVAEGELKLIDTMLQSKVWEELEEKPQPGQWDYFARDQHTRGTQEPPDK